MEKGPGHTGKRTAIDKIVAGTLLGRGWIAHRKGGFGQLGSGWVGRTNSPVARHLGKSQCTRPCPSSPPGRE